MRTEGHLNSVERGRIACGPRSSWRWSEGGDSVQRVVRAGALEPGTCVQGPTGAKRQRDKINEAFGLHLDTDRLPAVDPINGGATVAPEVDQTASGSVTFLFRTLGALTTAKRYLLSQGMSSTGSPRERRRRLRASS